MNPCLKYKVRLLCAQQIAVFQASLNTVLNSEVNAMRKIMPEIRAGLRLLLLSLALCGAALAQAEDEKPAEEAPAEGDGAVDLPNAGSIYVPVKPALVVNYGGAGRLKYIKADISVRVQDTAAAESVRHHLPYIRNNLVMLFSAQTDESISSQDGKEALRKEALQTVRDLVMQEDKQEGIIDLFFNTFLIQN